MPNKAYRKGYTFEIYVANYLRKNGFYVVRSAGSHGVFDLIAIYHGQIYGIQCKTDGRLLRKELTEIVKTAEKHGIIPFLAFRDKRRVKIANLLTSECVTLKEFVNSVINHELSVFINA